RSSPARLWRPPSTFMLVRASTTSASPGATRPACRMTTTRLWSGCGRTHIPTIAIGTTTTIDLRCKRETGASGTPVEIFVDGVRDCVVLPTLLVLLDHH